MPPEHSPAWILGMACSAALLIGGLTIEYTPGIAGHVYVGSGLVLVGAVSFVGCFIGYLRHYRRMTESPLIVRYRPACCDLGNDFGKHVRLEIFNPEDLHSVSDVEPQITIVGAAQLGSEFTGRLMKWVGEHPSQRAGVAAGSHHHVEFGGTVSNQPYVVFWHPPEKDPRTFHRTLIAPGHYKAEVTIRSQRKPVTHDVEFSCTPTSFSVARLLKRGTGA